MLNVSNLSYFHEKFRETKKGISLGNTFRNTFSPKNRLKETIPRWVCLSQTRFQSLIAQSA